MKHYIKIIKHYAIIIIALTLTNTGHAYGQANIIKSETYLLETVTDPNGRFRAAHGLNQDTEGQIIVGITVGAKSRSNGSWYSIISWADEYRFSWNNDVVAGVLVHDDFLNTDVRILIFTRH